MKKEEKILIDKFGKANHFSVPEGYFESFTDQMMDLLPESEARVIEMRPATWWNRLPIKKVAAAVGAVLVSRQPLDEQSYSFRQGEHSILLPITSSYHWF